MSDGDSIKTAVKAMEAEKARRLAEAAAEIDRDMAAEVAELERLTLLAAKYNLRVVSADSLVQVPDHHNTPTINKTEPALAPSVSATAPAVAAPTVAASNGPDTLGELVGLYRTDTRSPYRTLRFGVRSNTDNWLDRIAEDHGHLRLAELNADGIRELYDLWADGGTKLASGHGFATKLRGLFGFGTTVLDDPRCQRLSTIMNKMRFTNPPARTERLTADHVVAIRAKAHELGKPSIALAQAIQYECWLTQKDTIGEYVPATEPGSSDIIVDGNKWLYGVRWEEIDGNLILRHVSSYGNKPLELDLKRAPMVLEELQRQFPDHPKKGPIIVSEWSGKPWSAAEYRRWWRRLADAAGVPKSIKNMDSSRAVDRNKAVVPPAKEPELVLDPSKEIRLH
jgi:hypothetical protein